MNKSLLITLSVICFALANRVLIKDSNDILSFSDEDITFDNKLAFHTLHEALGEPTDGTYHSMIHRTDLFTTAPCVKVSSFHTTDADISEFTEFAASERIILPGKTCSSEDALVLLVDATSPTLASVQLDFWTNVFTILTLFVVSCLMCCIRDEEDEFTALLYNSPDMALPGEHLVEDQPWEVGSADL
eukprot:gnl/Dysnectes_brevis/1250_a1397_4162.p1 GENE.gnl/Dysnectes_brevis/1250_a1397_4162~~gnl/Dysnectes_brevis/1250_a1397_4162.p1  ORF type:complete len:188 (+),score=54.09 gnl/Dysnectes_brevis/1250_a1397_4162:18-581(+)